MLKGQLPAVGLDGAFEITRSLPHGHVAAMLGTLRAPGLEELIDRPRPGTGTAVAQAHAVLALAAATALGTSSADSRAWADVAGTRLQSSS